MSPAPQPPLIPLLDPEDAVGDSVALATWYDALSNALGFDLPHDLLALWLYPTSGGSVLVGPEALAQDHLDVPLPSPLLSQDRLFALEEVIRRARYASVMTAPIRFGGRDVGLILLADLQSGRYTPDQAVMLQIVADGLSATFGRIARQWGAAPGTAAADEVRGDTLAEGIAVVLASAGTPKEFSESVFQLLTPYVPVDHGELLIGGAADQWYRLGEHGSGPLWSDPSLVLTQEQVNVAQLFGDADQLLIPDTQADPRWAGWPGAMQGMRSAIGVKLRAAGRRVGFMIFGAAGTELYQERDLELLAEAGALIGPRVENYILTWHLQVLRTHLGTMRNVPVHLGRVAELLATVSEPGEATRRFAAEAASLLPFDLMRFALLVADDRAVILDPGETRPPSALPSASMTGTALGQVLAGELPSALLARPHEAELIVPLRVAGKIIGAMSLTTHGAAVYARSDLPHAQQLGDLIAPHLALAGRRDPNRPPGARRHSDPPPRSNKPDEEESEIPWRG